VIELVGGVLGEGRERGENCRRRRWKKSGEKRVDWRRVW
jgi:hypothetical protein